MAGRFLNWAGNVSYSARNVHFPSSVEEVQELVRRSPKVRALGTRHAFNEIADTDGDLVCVAGLDRVVKLSPERKQVTVEAGMRYGELCRFLDQEGFALPNLASLPHISVAGACATATHGSGNENGNLATSVAGLEVVNGAGEVVTLGEYHKDDLPGASVSLGALGVVVRVTLNLEPTYEVRQVVYEDLPLSKVLDNFEAISSSAYSVSLFTDWKYSSFNQAWLKFRHSPDREEPLEASFFGGGLVSEDRHPINGKPTEACTPQAGIAGAWFERLPHFKLEFTPSSGDELQSEYLVPRKRAADALMGINNLKERIAPLLQVCEIRTVASDFLWMSPCYQRACAAIHFTWLNDWESVSEVLPEIEQELAPLQARPHWGKLFTADPAHVRSLYPMRREFVELARRHDPNGKFRNAFLDRYVFGD